ARLVLNGAVPVSNELAGDAARRVGDRETGIEPDRLVEILDRACIGAHGLQGDAAVVVRAIMSWAKLDHLAEMEQGSAIVAALQTPVTTPEMGYDRYNLEHSITCETDDTRSARHGPSARPPVHITLASPGRMAQPAGS